MEFHRLLINADLNDDPVSTGVDQCGISTVLVLIRTNFDSKVFIRMSFNTKTG